MSSVLYQYPEQAAFHRPVPKAKIYAYAKASRSVRDCFVKEVEQIVWKYKLSSETINLPARRSVPEIQVFGIDLRTEKLSDVVPRTIDKAIPYPIFFELTHERRVRVVAAYKRPSEADASKWVVGAYFESDWAPADSPREPLPVALDLLRLYEQMLRRYIPYPARPEEPLPAQVERVSIIRSRQSEQGKLESRLRQERQFNRKVEINRQLRAVTSELESLLG